MESDAQSSKVRVSAQSYIDAVERRQAQCSTTDYIQSVVAYYKCECSAYTRFHYLVLINRIQ